LKRKEKKLKRSTSFTPLAQNVPNIMAKTT